MFALCEQIKKLYRTRWQTILYNVASVKLNQILYEEWRAMITAEASHAFKLFPHYYCEQIEGMAQSDDETRAKTFMCSATLCTLFSCLFYMMHFSLLNNTQWNGLEKDSLTYSVKLKMQWKALPDPGSHQLVEFEKSRNYSSHVFPNFPAN